MATDVRQLLLQVDASVAVAQRNLNQLARQVANDANSMDGSLGRAEKAFGRVNKSAEESAQAFLEGDRAAKALIASIDPLAAAQQRYDRELEKANQLYKTGALSAAELARVQTGLKAQLDQSHTAFGRVGGVAGNVRSGMQQLSFQMGDVAQGFALGVKPMTIFAQQSGQVIQSLQLMGGGANKFMALLAGPWGLALSVATSVIVLLASRHKDAAESVDTLVEKMRKESDQARLNETANKIWANSIDGVIDAQRKLRGEIEQTIQVEQVQNQQNLAKAQEGLDRIRKELASKQAELAKLQGRRGQVAAGLENPLNTPEDNSAIQVALDKLDGKIKTVSGSVKTLQQGLTDAEKTIRTAAIPVARDYADALNNASAAVGGFYDVVRNRVEIAAQDSQKLANSLTPLESAIEKARQASEAAASAGVNFGPVARQVQQLTKSLVDGKIGPDAYTKSVNALAKSLDAAAKAAEAAKKSSSGLSKFSLGEAKGIVTNELGGTITSTTGGKHAKNSYHYAAQAIDFVPKGGMDSLTKAAIRQAFEAAGAKILELLGPGDKGHDDHFHVAFAKTRLGPDQIARAREGRESKEEAARLRGVKLENSYEERAEQLNSALLAAKMDLVEGTEAQAEYAEELVRQEQKRIDAAIQNDVEEGKLTQAQADILKGKNEEIANQKIKNIEVQKQLKLLREQEQAEQDATEFAIDMLRGREGLVKSIAERKALELQILDLVYKEKEAHLQTLKAQAELAGNTAEAARIQAEINRLPARKASDTASINQQNQSPWDSYLSGLPTDSKVFNERLQQIQVAGVESLVNVLTEARHGWAAMRDAAISALDDIIGQLIKLQLDQWVGKLFGAGKQITGQDGGASLAAAGTSLTAAGTSLTAAAAPLQAVAIQLQAAAAQLAAAGAMGGASGGLSTLSSLSSLIGAAGSFSGGGVSLAGAMDFSSFGSALLNIPAFASGGVLDVGGKGGVDNELLSINGVPRAWVSASEKLAVIPKVPTVSVPSNDNRGTTHNHISVTAPNTGNPRKDRATALQQAALVREAVATASRKNG